MKGGTSTRLLLFLFVGVGWDGEDDGVNGYGEDGDERDGEDERDGKYSKCKEARYKVIPTLVVFLQVSCLRSPPSKNLACFPSTTCFFPPP